MNAVGISPCLSVPGLEAHGGDEAGGVAALSKVVARSLSAGLVPVIHGDACLYGPKGAGILGGDAVVEALAGGLEADRTIFLTDVDGVYTSDPKLDNDAVLLDIVEVDGTSGQIVTDLTAGKSTHDHDVTGGLEVSVLVQGFVLYCV